MYAPVKTTGYRRARLAKAMALLTLLAGLSLLALGVVKAQTPLPKAGPTSAASSSVRLLHAYQLRCWQEGRLVLDEALSLPPAEGTPRSVRLQGVHGAASVVTLLEVGSATCLVRPTSER